MRSSHSEFGLPMPIQTNTRFILQANWKKGKRADEIFSLVAGTCPTNSSHEGTKHSLWD